MKRTVRNGPTEDDYFANDDASAVLMRALSRTAKPHLRSEYLHALAGYEWRRSQIHEAVFGPDPHDADGSPPAEWLADSARLLWTVADAEAARANIDPPPRERDQREVDLQVVAAFPLFCWTFGARRRPLLAQLVAIWAPLVRGQGAEAVACIPFPRWMR